MTTTLHFQRLLLFLCFALLGHTLQAQVSGAVFRDFNGNGTRDTNEPLVSGVTVNAYLANATTPCGTATTSGNTAPNYSVAGCGTAAVRVEFIIPTTGQCVNSSIDFSALGGGAYGSSVQFVSGNSTNVNFALHNPADYNQGTTNVSIFVPCYISGDPLATGTGTTTGSGDWFVGYNYTDKVSSPTVTNPTTTAPDQKVNGSVIGATWGVAYSKQANKIFTSALVKRHVGLGALGTGGIYMLSPTATSFGVTQFYDLDANGNRTRAAASAPAYGEGTSYAIAADNSTITYLGATDALTGKPSGLGVIGTNTQRGLTSSPTTPGYDPAAFDQVGKVGLGDIDISDDGKYLFVVNLYSRKVVRLELNDAYNPTSVVSVTSYDVPATTCANGEYRPWGLKFYRNKLYVGVVCSAENAGAVADLKATVYELTNPTASATFNTSPLLTAALNYAKKYTGFKAWTNDSDIPTSTYYPQPILSDIEITDNGDMVLGLLDRGGHQWGESNRRFLKTSTTSISISTVGDILIAGFNCTTGAFTLENNGKVTSASGSVLTGSTNAAEGPGGLEFFDDNSNSADPHLETATGALALVKGQGDVITTTFAQDKNSGDAGTMRLSTTDGSFIVDSYNELYHRNTPPGVLAKANGLGDIEVSGVEVPIEIGNRVWNDTDSDGIQDAGETGIAGVSVSLCTGAGATIATAVTDANGNYYFSSASGTSTGSVKYGLTALTANTSYQLKFPTTNSGKSLVTANTAADNIDSDALPTGIVSFSTASLGANNHNFDVGYGAATCSFTATATPTACNPATNTYSVTGLIGLTNNTTGGTATITDGAATTTVSIAANASSATYTLTGLTSNGASHTVTVSLPGCGSATATYNAPTSCTVALPVLAVVVGTPVCNSATNNYTATGTVSLTNATAGTLTITDNGTTIGTVSVTAGQATASFSVSGISNTASHTVIASLTGGTSGSAVYVAPVSCTVCSTSITTTSLPAGQVSTAYSQTITATGGATPYTYTLLGTLPTGLTISAAGVISGTPTSAATSSFTIKVTDSKSCTDIAALSITTSAAPVCSLTATATPGTCNTATNAYSVTGTVAGVNTPANQSLTISVGSSSTVVTMTSNGPVSYTLSGLTSDGLTKTVSVMSSATACGMTSVTYTAPVSCTIAPPKLAVVVGTPVCNSATNNYTATGTVSLTNATAGTLTITDNGTTIGTVSVTAGQATASFSVSGVSNAASHTVIATLTGGTSGSAVYVAPASCTVCSTSITTTSLPAGQVGTAYSQAIAATGGNTPYTYSLLGTLPAGLTLSAAGVISGTPTSAATSSFTIKVTDSKSCTDIAALSITTSAAPVCSLTATATPGTCNTATNAYSVTGTVAGVNTPANQSLTISVGSSSTVVTMTSNGPVSYTLSGLTSDGLTKTLSVLSSATACGSASVTYTAPASCTIAPPKLAVVVGTPVCNSATNNYTATGTVSLTNATAGTLTITDNGTTIGTVSVTAGQATASFSVSGVSNAASHTVIATLTGGTSASTVYVAPVSCTVCSTSITTTSLPAGQVSTAYSQTITATGGATPYTYTLLGTLPTGLTISAAGVISGTPTSAATSSFTIKVTDSKSCTDIAALSITTSAAPVCSLTATATPGTCNTATNAYSVTGTVAGVNTPANQSLTISVGSSSTVVTMTSNGPVSYTLSGLTSDGLTKTLSVLSSATACGSASVTYTAPASCTIAPPKLAVVVGTPVCNSATNNYTATGTVSLTNATAGTLTITDNGTTIGTISVTVGQATASFSVSGVSNAASHTVIATLTGGTSASAVYVAPVSCTVCSILLTSSALPRGKVGNAYSATLTASGGTAPYSYSVSGGSLPTGLTLNPTTGVISGTPTVSGSFPTTVTISNASGCVVRVPLTVIQIDLADVCALNVQVTPGLCLSATNQYSISGTVSFTSAIVGTLTITDGAVSTSVTVTASTTSVAYSLSGLSSGSGSHIVTASLSNCGSTSIAYAAPASCSVGSPTYAISKVVDLKQVEKGGIVTYTLSLTNTSSVTATNLVLTDQLSTTAVTLVGSATASAGTFTPGINSGTWSISSLAGGQIATLSFPVQLNEEGITYNTLTAPNGQTATVCVSVPAHVCTGEDFQFTLTAPASYSTYQWTRNGQPIAGATSSTYNVTAIGEYSVQATSLGGCPDGSCCPFIVVADPAPSLTALAVSAQCVDQTPQANAAITLVGSSTGAVSYNITKGSSFTAAAPLFASPQALAAVVGGVLAGGQPNPALAQDYTIRVYAADGCFADTVVSILPTTCACPPDKCAPFVIRKTKTAGKPVAP